MPSGEINSILNRSSIASRNTANSERLFKELRDVGTKIATNNKYLDLASMDADGVRKIVDRTRADLISIGKYENAITLTEPKLQIQSKALTDINAVLTRFNIKIGDTNPNPPAKDADVALKELQDILTQREGGEYLFGGKNSFESPLLYDIVNTSNNVEGLPTSNYTNAAEDTSDINVTDNISVRVNRLNAGFSGIQEAISMLHSYKGGTNGTAATITKIGGITESISNLQLQINTDIDSVNGANNRPGAKAILTDRRAVATTKLNNILQIDINQTASEFSALLASALTTLSVTQARNNVVTQISQALRS